MVRIPGGVVRLGMRATPPVPGFEPPVPPGPPAGGAGPGGGPLHEGMRPDGPGALPDHGIAPGGAPTGGKPVPDPLNPPRDVTVSTFWLDLTEVTRDQYAVFLRDTAYRPPYVDEDWARDGWNWEGATPPRGTGDHPVVLIHWYDARAYCAWADKRLPTEAEWQLAALGPAQAERLFPWGDTYDGARLNHGTLLPPNYDDSDGWERTAPVGSFPDGATPEGVQDLFGNAWEWVEDVRGKGWEQVRTRDGARAGGSGPWNDPVAVGPALYAASRGGAFFFDLRPNPSGERSAFLAELRRKSTGFRCARDP